MQIASLTFIMIVLPSLLLIYYLIPDKIKQIFLVLCSFGLYSYGNPIRVLYPMAFLCYDYGTGLLLEKYRRNRILSTVILCFSVMLQITVMSYIRSTAQRNIFFPFGIAIYTLQGLGYLIGVYRRHHSAEGNVFFLGLYLLFFPSVFAGGLYSYAEFAEQNKHKQLNVVALSDGLSIFIRGLAEKVVLADTFGYIFRELKQIEPENMSMLTAWLMTIIFSMYLYFELLGYSEMSRGLGKCLGYTLPKNFSHPFFTPSITAFMQSWNITLVLWFDTNFRRVLFRRCSRKWLNATGFILMWILIGAWYGIRMQFILWGLLTGILLLMEKIFSEKNIPQKYIAGVIYTAVISQFLWVMFFSENLSEAAVYYKAMLGFRNGILDRTGIYFLVSYIALILTGLYIATDLFRNISERLTVSQFGQKLMAFMPLIHGGLWIFCLASMLNGEQQLWLWL